MDYNWHKVDPSRILCEDETFKISTSSSIETLAASIARVGLVNPPVLRIHENQFLIICGFSRIEACRQLGWSQIPARCLDAHTPWQQCALLAVAEAVSQGHLNIIEQARALALLNRFHEAPMDAIAAANAVGFTMNSRLAEKLSAVKTFGSQLQQGLLEDTIGLPAALRMHGMFTPDDSEHMSVFLRLLRLSLTRQKEVLEWIETILRLEGIKLSELLSDPQIEQWRLAPELDDPQRSRLIREYLRRRCYPTITAYEKHYADTIKKIRLGQGICISPPPNFEGQAFSLRIDFSNHDEFVKRMKQVQQLVQSSAFYDLLEPQFKPND